MPPRDPRGWMWAEACEMLERAERLHRQFFEPVPSAARRVWQPPADLFETEDALWVLVALPGVPRERVRVAVEGGTLRVTGERPIPRSLRAAAVHRLEIPYGRFERRVELPPGHYDIGEHDLVDGCLVLSLRKLV